MSEPAAQHRFLHLTPINPALAGNGLAMRTGMFTQALARLGPTSVVVIGGAGEGAAMPGAASVEHVPVRGREDTRLRLIGRIADDAARAAAMREAGRPASTANLSAPVLGEVSALIARQRWSAVIVSRSYLLPILQQHDFLAEGVSVLVDLDDDDAALCRELARLARQDGDLRRALWLDANADAYDRLIRETVPRVSAFACASASVRSSLAGRLGLDPIAIVPNGVTLPDAGPETPASGLLFVGNLSYPPNIDGIVWFMAQVWPLLLKNLAEPRLVVAGRDPSGAVRQACTADGVELVENPADLAPLYRRAAAAIVPLRSGSGSRIKILEAGAHGVPVVSTDKGREGIALDAESDIFASRDDAGDFAAACLRCLADPAEAGRRAARLQALVRERHDRERIVGEIADLVASAIGRAVR